MGAHVNRPRVAHITTVDLSLRFLLLAQLRALRDEGFEVTAISAPGPWVADLEAEAIRHIPWGHATRSWDPRSDAVAFVELLRILRRERFDAVHTHNPKPGVLGRVAARAARVPVVLNTVHGLWATPEDRARRRLPVLAAEWAAARFSDLELYQSREDLAWARRRRVVGPGRSILLGNGIDLDRFHPSLRGGERRTELRAELGFGPGDVVIGTVGRMVREKGYRELFAAAQALRAQDPDARFLVVGEADPAKPDAVTAEEVLAARPHVTFTGWREDVPDLMAAMDVFVLPSWREGMPRSAIEASAAGLPLVLTDIRGCREVVSHGIEGLLVPVRRPDALADALLRLVRRPDLRERMGLAARVRAERDFDERRVASTVVAVTGALLEAAGRRRLPAPGGVRVVPARPHDAPALARLHSEAMPQAFLPTLGPGFMRRLYRSMVRDPEAVVLVARDGDRVVGFAAAVPSVRRFYRWFALHGAAGALAVAAPRLLRAEARRGARETSRYPAGVLSLPEAELLSIAVDPAYRSRRIGRDLSDAVIDALSRRGVREVKVVVGSDNDGANRFYRGLGFTRAAETQVHRGVSSNVMVVACPR